MADRPRRNQGQAAPPADVPPNAPAQQLPRAPPPYQPAAAPPAAHQNPLFVRAPPQFKSGTDLDLYIQRFRAYARAANCPPAEQGDLLLSLLDDKALTGVSRAIGQGNLDLDELIAQLRRAEGYNANSERYVTELRNRRRLRNESIWEYHLDLHKLATKAYPNDLAMREGSLRESFIANINDTYIASRLRELQNLDMEELLDVAIMLHGCQTASAKQVHNIESSDSAASLNADVLHKLNHVTERLDNLSMNQTFEPFTSGSYTYYPPLSMDMSTAMVSNMQPAYKYTGPRQSLPPPPVNPSLIDPLYAHPYRAPPSTPEPHHVHMNHPNWRPQYRQYQPRDQGFNGSQPYSNRRPYYGNYDMPPRHRNRFLPDNYNDRRFNNRNRDYDRSSRSQQHNNRPHHNGRDNRRFNYDQRGQSNNRSHAPNNGSRNFGQQSRSNQQDWIQEVVQLIRNLDQPPAPQPAPTQAAASTTAPQNNLN